MNEKFQNMRVVALAGAGLLLLAGLLPTLAPQRAGAVSLHDNGISVVDGNTLQIGDRVFPLYGSDAPELGQLCFHDGKWEQCGITAAFELQKLLKFDAPLDCKPARKDPRSYVCRAGHIDLAQVLLSAGYAVATPGSGAVYHDAERKAREGKLGLWHMSFLAPWEWRAGKRMPGASDAADAGCPIKGAIDAMGRKLYYVPTDKNYKKIEIELSRGEKVFCSVEAVRAAGWHRPGEAAGR